MRKSVSHVKDVELTFSQKMREVDEVNSLLKTH